MSVRVRGIDPVAGAILVTLLVALLLLVVAGVFATQGVA